MLWCQLYQCWCDEVDEETSDDVAQYCEGFVCKDCDAAIEFSDEEGE